jgi:UDP:flavonoid glycosyltransferase YjiC (YdhE family)
MTNTILIVPFSYWGPVNCTLKFAKALKQRGHQVIYVVPDQFELFLKHSGFEVFTYSTRVNINKHTLLDRLTRVYKGSLQRDKLLNGYVSELMTKYNPTMVWVDADVPRYAAAFKRRVKIITYSVTPGNGKMSNIPPYFSKYIPKENWISKLYVTLIWNLWFVKKKIYFSKLELLSLGHFDFNLKKYYRKNRLNIHELETKRAWPVGFKDTPELLLYPKEFDFKIQRVPRGKLYIGPWVDFTRENQTTFNWNNIPTNRYTICCSMGTLATLHFPEIAHFYRLMISAVKQLPEVTLIMALDDSYSLFASESAGNIFLFNKIPLLSVLPKCQLLISHGGMNTAKEAILNKIPLLLLPLNDQTDQNGVAARCVFHGVAKRRNIRSVKIEMLINDITELLVEPVYRSRMELLSKQFADSELDIETVLKMVQNC